MAIILRNNYHISTGELLENIKDLAFIAIKNCLAIDKADQFCGCGIEFKAKDKEIHKKWHELDKLSNIWNLIYESVIQESKTGACILTLNKNVLGQPILTIANPFYCNNLARSFATNEMAILYEQFKVDSEWTVIKAVYDTEKVVRTFWNYTSHTEIQLQGIISKISKQNQIDFGIYDEEKNCFIKYHNLGFCPVWLIANRPFTPRFPIWNAGIYFNNPFLTNGIEEKDYSNLADGANTKGLAFQIQNIFVQQARFALLSQPKLLISRLSEVVKDRLKKEKWKGVLDNFIVDLFGEANINLFNPTNSLNVYDESLETNIARYWKMNGVSYQIQTGSQKTSQESFNVFDKSIVMINSKKTYQLQIWRKIIEALFKTISTKLKYGEWYFDIKRNLSIDESRIVDDGLKQIPAGALTPAEYISKINHVDSDLGEYIWNENKEWFKKNDYDIAMKEGQGAQGIKNVKMQNEKGGRPVDNGKQ